MVSAGVGFIRGIGRDERYPRIILARGDRVTSITIRPWLAGTSATIGFLFAVLYIAATGYLILRDDLLAASIARQSQIRLAYEDRIATMRSDMDRLTSRHLLNWEAMESELRRLVERQAVLDARQDVIAGLSQAARQAGIHPVTVTPATDRQDLAAPRRVRAETTLQHAPLRGRSAAGGNDQMARFQSLDAAADELLSRQMEYVNTMGRAVSDSSGTLSSVLSRLGVSQSQADARGSKGIGGPFVALPDRPGADQFMSAATAVADQVQRFSRTKSLIHALPLARPLAQAPVSSSYGPRLDPFLRRPAMHYSTDFQADSGRPVKATAAGVVVSAKYSGGYGKVVEIDHGNGFVTRFAHLGRMTVSEGQTVALRDIVGKVGSTGRSTGPHLHYEVRRDGRPIDPHLLFRAGNELAGLM